MSLDQTFHKCRKDNNDHFCHFEHGYKITIRAKMIQQHITNPDTKRKQRFPDLLPVVRRRTPVQGDSQNNN